MDKKIKKALNAAMQRVSLTPYWLDVEVPNADTTICVYVKDEQETAERVERAKMELDYRRNVQKLYRPYSDDYYTYIFGERVESNDVSVTVEVWENCWGLRECWYFIGNRSDWYNKVYRVCFDDKGTSLIEFDMPIPRNYGWEPFFQFVRDVYKALTIEPSLFETYYKYYVTFYYKQNKMKYKLESVDGCEYERVE